MPHQVEVASSPLPDNIAMSDWWTTIALPVIAFMRRQNYPAASLDAYALFWRNEILPLSAFRSLYNSRGVPQLDNG